MIDYWKNVLQHTYSSIRDRVWDLVIISVILVPGYVINYYRVGASAAILESISSIYSGVLPTIVVVGTIFLIRLLVVTPPKLHKLLENSLEALRAERNQIKDALTKVQTPQLQFDLCEEDKRYMRISHVQLDSHALDRYQGFLSVENPPSQVKSVDDVTIVLIDVIGGGEDLSQLKNVRLHFENQLPGQAVTIHPGEKKFVCVVNYNAQQGGGRTQLFISHDGADGQSSAALSLPPVHSYTAKIHVRAKDMALLSTTVNFGVDNRKLYIRQTK